MIKASAKLQRTMDVAGSNHNLKRPFPFTMSPTPIQSFAESIFQFFQSNYFNSWNLEQLKATVCVCHIIFNS